MAGPIPQRLLRLSRKRPRWSLKRFDPRRYYEESRRIGYDFCLVEQLGGEMTISERFPEDIEAVAERRAELQAYLKRTPGGLRLLADYLKRIGRVGRLPE